MQLHANARTCPKSGADRREDRRGGRWRRRPRPPESASAPFEWLARWRAEGEAGLLSLVSPKRVPSHAALRVEAIVRAQAADDAARSRSCCRWRLDGVGGAAPRRARQAQPTRRQPATARARAARRALAPRRQEAGPILSPGHRVVATDAARRRSVEAPGAAGWEFVHVCVDDATRLAYAELAPTARRSAAGFLPRVAWFQAWHPAQRCSPTTLLLPLNSPRRRLPRARLRHSFTRPYRPNQRKAERFIKTLTQRWPTRDLRQLTTHPTRYPAGSPTTTHPAHGALPQTTPLPTGVGSSVVSRILRRWATNEFPGFDDAVRAAARRGVAPVEQGPERPQRQRPSRPATAAHESAARRGVTPRGAPGGLSGEGGDERLAIPARRSRP